MRYRLSDVNPTRISLCKRGANGKRFFLRKEHGDTADTAALERDLIVKADWTAVYCVVAEPDAIENGGLLAPTDEDVWDSHEEIRKACHRFAKNGGVINLNHADAFGGTMVENAIAHQDFTIQAPDGSLHTIRKGSWYVAIEPDAPLRAAIEAGEVTGVSLEGDGLRVPVEKAQLNAKKRDKLPDSAFALPGRRYPIHDAAHARNALSRVAQNGTPDEQKKVRAAVKQRHPGIVKQDGTVTTASMGGNGTVGPSVICPKCKHKVPAAKSSCPNCGRDVSKLKGAFARNKKPVKKSVDESLLAPCPAHRDGGWCFSCAGTGQVPRSQLTKADASPDRPIPDKPGINNWIDKYGPDLPPYFKKVAEDIYAKTGTVGQAIRITWGTLRNWAHGKGKVTAQTRAKAAAALADLHRMQAAAHASHMVKMRPPAADGAALAAIQRTLEREMDDRSLLRKIAAQLGIQKAEGPEDENVPTFEDIIVARELNDELPDAFDALQQAIYMALSPNAGGDPVAIIQESLDEFGTWASSLVQRLQGGDAALQKSLADQLARVYGEGDTDAMTDEQFAQLQKSQEDNASATKELIGLVREMVQREQKRADDATSKSGEGDGGKEPVQKQDGDKDVDTQVAELRKSMDAVLDERKALDGKLESITTAMEKLAEGRSSQREPVAKSSGDAWAGRGILFG